MHRLGSCSCHRADTERTHTRRSLWCSTNIVYLRQSHNKSWEMFTDSNSPNTMIDRLGWSFFYLFRSWVQWSHERNGMCNCLKYFDMLRRVDTGFLFQRIHRCLQLNNANGFRHAYLVVSRPLLRQVDALSKRTFTTSCAVTLCTSCCIFIVIHTVKRKVRNTYFARSCNPCNPALRPNSYT